MDDTSYREMLREKMRWPDDLPDEAINDYLARQRVYQEDLMNLQQYYSTDMQSWHKKWNKYFKEDKDA